MIKMTWNIPDLNPKWSQPIVIQLMIIGHNAILFLIKLIYTDFVNNIFFASQDFCIDMACWVDPKVKLD